MADKLNPAQLAEVHGVVQLGVQAAATTTANTAQGIRDEMVVHSNAIAEGLKVNGAKLEEKFANMESNLRSTFESFQKTQQDMQTKQE